MSAFGIVFGRIRTLLLANGQVHRDNVTSFWRDTGPIVIATRDDMSLRTIEVVVSEFRNRKLVPLATITNDVITKAHTHVIFEIPLAVRREHSRILEYSIRELPSNNTLQKGSWMVRPSADNFAQLP